MIMMHHIFDRCYNLVKIIVMFVKFRVLLLNFLVIIFPVDINWSVCEEDMVIRIFIHLFWSTFNIYAWFMKFREK